MSDKVAKATRKAVKKAKKAVAIEMIRELSNAPLKFRFMFAMRVLFKVGLKGVNGQ